MENHQAPVADHGRLRMNYSRDQPKATICERPAVGMVGMCLLFRWRAQSIKP
jgi:hypothetical protein